MRKPPWPSDWFIDTDTMTFEPRLTRALGSWWRERVYEPHGVSPRGFAEMLVSDLPEQNSVRFIDFARRVGRVSVQMLGKAGNAIIYLAGHSLVITPTVRMAEADLIAVESRHQYKGIGTQIMSNLCSAASAVGIDRIGLKAGLEVGPYVWIKFGFVPTDDDWAAIKRPIRQKLDALGGMVATNVRDLMLTALASPSGQAIGLIAAEGSEVMSRSKEGVVRNVPLGFALLADTGVRWYGELDLSDPDAMALLDRCRERNLGGTKR